MNAHIDYNHAINHEGLAYLNDSPIEYMHIKRLMTVAEFLLQDKDVCRFMDDALDFLDSSSSSRQLKKLGEPAIYPTTIAKIVKFRSEDWLGEVETPIYKGEKPTLFESFFGASTYTKEENIIEHDQGAVKLWNMFEQHLGSLALFILAYKDYHITNDWEYFFYINFEEKEKTTFGDRAFGLALGQLAPGLGMLISHDDKKQIKALKEKYLRLKDNLYVNPLAELVAKYKKNEPLLS